VLLQVSLIASANFFQVNDCSLAEKLKDVSLTPPLHERYLHKGICVVTLG
jgi:hypothetical protein